MSPTDFESIDVCNLCGADDHIDVGDVSFKPCQVVMCKNCGLFFTSPALKPENLEKFYQEEFDGDAGVGLRSKKGNIEKRKIIRQENVAKKWAYPIIKKYLDVKDKQILDLRCRGGALAEILSKAGAQVTAIDPLNLNVDYAKSRLEIHEVRYMPIVEFERLDQHFTKPFDAVTALTIHTMAHTPDPKKYLQAIFRLLRPGGYLFLDEKDVFHPINAVYKSVFDSGPAHFYHFTADNVRAYLENVGFRLITCQIDKKRKMSFRHINVVAQKPEEEPNSVPPCKLNNVQKRLESLALSERKLKRVRVINNFRRGIKAKLREFTN